MGQSYSTLWVKTKYFDFFIVNLVPLNKEEIQNDENDENICNLDQQIKKDFEMMKIFAILSR